MGIWLRGGRGEGGGEEKQVNWTILAVQFATQKLIMYMYHTQFLCELKLKLQNHCCVLRNNYSLSRENKAWHSHRCLSLASTWSVIVYSTCLGAYTSQLHVVTQQCFLVGTACNLWQCRIIIGHSGNSYVCMYCTHLDFWKEPYSVTES